MWPIEALLFHLWNDYGILIEILNFKDWETVNNILNFQLVLEDLAAWGLHGDNRQES